MAPLPPVRSFAQRSAAFKLAVLIVGALLASLAGKGLGHLLGARGEWTWLEDRNLGQFLFLAGAVLLMGIDRLPMGAFGLRVPRDWRRRSLLAIGLAALLIVGYYALAASLGAVEIRLERLGSSFVQGVIRILRAFARATMAQILASGYAFGLLRPRLGVVGGAVASALLFACLYDPFALSSVVLGPGLPYFLGAALGMTVLCLLRSLTGELLSGIGALGTWLYIQDLIRRGRLLHPDPDANPALVAWLLPDREALAAPVFWLLLTALGALLLMQLRRRGEAPLSTTRAPMPASFKRVYPLAQPNAFATLDIWLARLFHARFRVGLVYLPRLACALFLSAVNTVVSLPERLLLPLLLCRRRVLDPVFVLGTHRSGTTHLHNLLALDRAYVAPKLYQVSNPTGFLFSGWLAVPLMACAPSRRPMDSMAMHVFAPSEDEFAMANSCGLSPYWGPVFPQEGAYYDGFIHPADWTPSQRKRWDSLFLGFCRRLTLFNGRRPLFKNPFHTARVAHLRGLFPDARFVHIRRDPRDVYRSNLRLNDEGFLLFQVQDPDPQDSFKTRFFKKYRDMETAYLRDAETLSEDHRVEVTFSELESDPLGTIERIYAAWGLEISPAYRARLESYIAEIADYRKNVHPPLEPDAEAEMHARLGPLLERWGYGTDPTDAAI